MGRTVGSDVDGDSLRVTDGSEVGIVVDGDDDGRGDGFDVDGNDEG